MIVTTSKNFSVVYLVLLIAVTLLHYSISNQEQTNFPISTSITKTTYTISREDARSDRIAFHNHLDTTRNFRY